MKRKRKKQSGQWIAIETAFNFFKIKLSWKV